MRIFILLGNPDTHSLAGDFADVYEREARKAGHEIKRLNLGDLHFDPILHKGYKMIQELEPDLKLVQENMKWCEHFVLLYPLWWSSMPALLKGMWDRMFLPGFAFHMHKNKMGWDKLLKGRTARVIILSKNWPILIRSLFGNFTNEISRALLGFAGFKVHLTEIGHSENATPALLTKWEKNIANLARKGI
ncbi:NAD(P)H-dependent oxidoreductase [Patescibacteria group bacterium]|nr:NAD(P)H-dependent oxidoreductase [Patescibacteria group bacterium]